MAASQVGEINHSALFILYISIFIPYVRVILYENQCIFRHSFQSLETEYFEPLRQPYLITYPRRKYI
jgi:hypothetical protein